MKKVLAFALASFAVTIWAAPSSDVYNGVVTNTWTGTADTAWENSSNWSLNQVPYIQWSGSNTDGQYALFNPSEALTVQVPSTALSNEGTTDKGIFANGILVATGAAQVTISSGWYSSFLYLRRQNNRPTIVNDSSNRLILTIPVAIHGGYGSSGTVGYGPLGIYPGVEYNRKFEARGSDAANFVFYGGKTDNADMNISIFKGETKFFSHPVVIEANHTVQLVNSSTSTASMTVTSVTVQDGGSLVLNNGTTLDTTSVTGSVTINGTATIKHGTGTLTLGGNWTFASGAAVILEGTGDVVYADGANIDKGKVMATGPYVKFKNTGTGNDENKYIGVADNWDGTLADADALVDARSAKTHVRTGGATAEDFEFAGSSLTLIGASGKEARLIQKCPTNTIGTIVFKDYSEYQLGGHGSNSGGKEHVVKANFVIDGTGDGAVKFYSDNGRSFLHDGTLSGAGALKLTNTTTTGNAIFNFCNESPDFTGAIQVNGATVTAYFDSANGMGGNPAATLAKGLELIYGGTVAFTAETVLTIDQAHRGLYVSYGDADRPGGTLSLANDVTWKGPLGMDSNAVLTKTGTGSLILAGTNTAAVGKINVSGGSVVVANPYSAGKITVTGTAMLPSLTPTAEEEAAKKFAAKDWLFVPDGLVANTPAENLALVTSRGWTVPTNYGLPSRWATTLSQVEVEGGGVMLKVSGKLRGFEIVIR